MKTSLLSTLLVLAVTASLFAQSKPSEAVLVSGDRITGRVQKLDQNEVTFSQQGKVQTIRFAELFRWGNLVENRRKSQVVLTSGGVLTARIVRVEDEILFVDSPFFGALKIPVRSAKGLLYKPLWEKNAGDKARSSIENFQQENDRVELVGGDSLAGVLLDFVAADPYDDDVEGRIRIRLPDSPEVIDGSDDRVRAILFNAALAKEPPSLKNVVWLGWSDGSLLPVRKIEPREGLVHLTLASGLTAVTDDYTFFKELTCIRPENEKVVWLSDLPPLAYKHTPFLNLTWPLKLNRNAVGGRLRSTLGVHEKGVGMHSRSRVAFETNGAKRFQASVAIDQAVGNNGSVEFRVYKNVGGEWSPAWSSGVVRGGEPPQHVNISVEEAAAILLIVDFADRGDTHDYANWLDARFIR